MATSGIISGTTFTTRKVIERASFRAGLSAEKLTPEHIAAATDSLYLLLSDLANQGAPLWCIEKVILPLYDGNPNVPTGVGTVDIMNANFRKLQGVTGTNTDAAASRTVQFDSPTVVSTVGILWSGPSASVALERSDGGVVWTTVQTETTSAVAGEWTWFDLESAVASTYFRVRATAGTLDFASIYMGNNPTEITLGRINKDDYTSLPNKVFTSNQPQQYWLDRQVPEPIMRVWPAPNLQAETQSQIVIWRQRYVMDVGTLTQTLDIPQRWFEAVVASLAAKLVVDYPDADLGRAGLLDTKAQQALYTAWNAESDDSPLNLVPDLSAYTA